MSSTENKKEKTAEKVVFYCLKKGIDVIQCINYFDRVCERYGWYYSSEEDYLPYDYLASARKDIVEAVKRIIRREHVNRELPESTIKGIKKYWRVLNRSPFDIHDKVNEYHRSIGVLKNDGTEQRET